MKKTGWVYVEEGLPATRNVFEVSRGEVGRERVEWLRWIGDNWLENDGQFYAIDVYAYRSLPEPAPRRR